MKILILDNYDSFTYNLVQYFEELTEAEIVVKRNDEINIDKLKEFDILVFSPGPGLPDKAGIMIDAIKKYAGKKKMLGVCLGHQAIGVAFGAELINLKKVYHGVKTNIKILDEDDSILKNIGKQTAVGRYHSWVINPETLSKEFKITSVSPDNSIMSIKHLKYDIWGVQFHPESIMTDEGKKIIENFIKA